MTRILQALPLPRRLSSAIADLRTLAQAVYELGSDVHEYLQRRDAELETVLQAFDKRISELEDA
jgi:hypothetical protein